MAKTAKTIGQAIRESIQTDRIVTIEGNAATHEALLALADDSADQPELTEYWGTDDDGRSWRIHVTR